MINLTIRNTLKIILHDILGKNLTNFLEFAFNQNKESFMYYKKIYHLK